VVVFLRLGQSREVFLGGEEELIKDSKAALRRVANLGLFGNNWGSGACQTTATCMDSWLRGLSYSEIKVIEDHGVFVGMELDYEIWQLVVAGLILLGSSLLQAVIGFGAGVFGIPLLLMAGFDHRTAIPIIVMTSMTQSLIGSVRLKDHAQWKIAWRPAGIRILVMPLGGWALFMVGQMGANYVRQAIGIVLLIIVITKLLVQVEPVKELKGFWTWIAFPISGFLLGFCGMGGPAVAIWVMAQPWNPLRSRAFLFNMLVTGMVPLSILLVLLFGGKAVLGLSIGIVGLPLVFLGTFLGMRVGDRLPKKKLQVISLIVLLLIAINAILAPVLRKGDKSPSGSVHLEDRQVTFDATVIIRQWDATSVITTQPGDNQRRGFPLILPERAHNCLGNAIPERSLAPWNRDREEGSCSGRTALGGYGLDGISVI
jgi:uncharacterized membrane protein YfcA